MNKRTAIIGNFNLVIECIQILKEQGFNIIYLFSETPSVLRWAKNQNILVAKDLYFFFNIIEQKNIDYLFSIQNHFVIPDTILNSINKLAINYHNTLLPKYAGTKNNVCWPIWFGEQESGITWHIMNSLIGTGDILKQKKILLDKSETAYSLQLKCQECAKTTLKELAFELQSEKVQREIQTLNKRSIFHSFSRPCGFAVINWNNTAENIERQFRALNFGLQHNPITTLKFKYKGMYFVVLEINLLEYKTAEIAPGKVIETKTGLLQVATKSYDILIKYKALNLHISTSEILPGEKLENEELPLEKQERVAEYIVQDEPYWKKIFSHFVPGKNFTQNKISNFNSYTQFFKIKFNELFPESLNPDSGDVLTILLSYLYRINNYENFSLCVSGKSVRIPEGLSPELFLEVKPLSVNLDNDLSFTEAKKNIKLLLSNNENKNTCFKDLLVRYSDFQKILVRNAVLLNISGKAPIQENIYPIIIDLDETNEYLSLFIANSYLEEVPFFIHFMRDHLKNLAKSWTTADTQLKKINFLSLKELQYLQNWNNTHVELSETDSISKMMDNICEKFPNNIAIETKDKKITYQELKHISDQIARNILTFFHNEKIKNNLIGVFLEKSANTILTFLGILKAGLTYVVLDTTYPDDYLENVIQSTEAKMFICQSSKHKHLRKIIHKIDPYERQVCLTLEQVLLKSNQEIRLPDNIPSTTLAYVLFTSGSTGKPKGVMISHHSVINLAKAVNTSIGITHKDKLLQFSTLAFDTSVWEIYASFFSGATLYIPEPSESRIGKNLQKTIVSRNISLSIFPPSVLKVQPYFESKVLKTIVVGGETCPPILPKRWGKYYRFINVYGPTESTVIATMSAELKPADEITIGRPIQNYQITICDRYQAELPVGAIGEIIISGAGVAQGYINNPELTAQKFKPLCILGQEKIGYLSGDLGKWTPQGQIKYTGRIDSQLKIRGFRVEPAMIEQVVNTYAGVNACIILPSKTEKERLFLNAYILIDDNLPHPDLKNIKNFLKAKLPHFMIPKNFFLINQLPLTTVGKIDYAKLLSNSEPDLEYLLEETYLHF